MTELKETIDTLQNSLSYCLVKHKIYCHVRVESHCDQQTLILLFHIMDPSDDRCIRELLHTLNVDIINSPLAPVSVPVLEKFCIGVRKVMLDLDKAYELLAVLKLEGY